MPPTRSPGPAKYELHTLVGYNGHEFNSEKNRQPQWSLGAKVKISNELRVGPGPANFHIANVTRYGKISTPAASLHQRLKDLKSNSSPGPTGNPVDPSLYRFRYGPKFTMYSRLKDLNIEKGPGPNQTPTDLDVYKTRSPKYPMGIRTKELGKDKFPAPNQYNSLNGMEKILKKYPAFSMGVKLNTLKKERIPSPAEYDIKNYHPFSRMPTFSMGIKHSEYAHVPIVPMDNC